MTPVEEDRALDGEDVALGERRGREAMDPATRHLAMMAGGIGLLLAVVIGGWALSGRSPGSIPVIQPPPGLVRVKPVNPGGLQGMGTQGPVPLGTGGPETLAAGAETADPSALQAEVEAARRRAQETPDASPATPPAASPGTIATARLPAAGQSRSAQDGGTAGSAAPASPELSSPRPDAGAGTAQSGNAGPGNTGEPRSSALGSSRPGSSVQGAPAAGAAAEGSADRGADHGHAQGTMVQLAALGSHRAALDEWERLRRAHRALLSGHSPAIESAQRSGHTIYRLRAGGFDSAAAAAAFCSEARVQKVACTVADF